MKAESKQSRQHLVSVAMTLIPTSETPETLPLSATVVSAVPNNGTTCNAKSNLCATSTQARTSSPTLVVDSIGDAKGLSPYWSDYTAEISSRLWLPTGIGLPGSDSSLSNGWPSKTAAASWFSVSRNTAPSGNSPRIFSPSSIPSVAGCMDSVGTKTQSKRIRIYPTLEQREILRLWFDAARWTYNETIARLKATGEPGAWKKIKTPIIHAAPERLQAAPYQVRSIAVRDACRAMSQVRRRNKGRSQADGLAEASFRSRKHPRQGCFIPASGVSPLGAYHTMLGGLRMAEALPPQHGDSRITLQNGQYHLVVTHPAQQSTAETQGRVVALDPGIRSFLTYFSETSTGHVGKNDFGRIQRLCAHLDNLLSKAKREKLRLRKRNLYAAAARARVRIGSLIDELHHQSARWLVDNFDLILIPSFETSEMAQRGQRKLRSKSVRMMLTFAHFRFRQFLIWKAWQTGKQVLVVNEAYTSKTCSWSGEIIANLGGRKVVRGSDGVSLERDINGARGIFLRALGDFPALRKLTQECIGGEHQLGVC